MTHDMSERPAKVIGPLDKMQTIGLGISVLVVLVLVFLFPFRKITNFGISLIPAGIIMLFFFSPKSQKILRLYIRTGFRKIRELFTGPEVYVHEGATGYYTRKNRKKTRIHRDREYKRYI